MKKLLSTVVLAGALLLGTQTVHATNEFEGDTGAMDVSVQVDPQYIVTIPKTTGVVRNAFDLANLDFLVGATDVVLPNGHELVINIEPTTLTEEVFGGELLLAASSTKFDSQVAGIVNNEISIPFESASASAGTFSGVMNFEIAVQPIVAVE